MNPPSLPSPDQPDQPDQPDPAVGLLDPPKRSGEIGRLGPYRVLDELGRGGMGIVFAAEDGRLKRNVALKVMRADVAQIEHARERFVQEARSMARVEHDNVATIYEVGMHRGAPFLAMERLRGQSLDSVLAAGIRYDIDTILRIAGEIAEGLAAAHAGGIIHRDIKPGNVWIEETGRVKILDFGLAIASSDGSGVDPLAARNSVAGSPGYLAPEQVRDDPVDDRTDLYSTGVVLYQLASGRLPLLAKTKIEQFIAVLCHRPMPLCEAQPAVPPAAGELIDRLLSKEPRDRPDSAAALAGLIGEAVDRCRGESRPTVAIVTAADDHLSRGRRGKSSGQRRGFGRNWWVAVVGVIIAGGGGFAFWLARSPDETDSQVQASDSRSGESGSHLTTPLAVVENLRDGELLGMEIVRTSRRRGADTFVRRASDDEFGDWGWVRSHRRGGNRETVEHGYLRFDFAECDVPRDEVDTAVLVLTAQSKSYWGRTKIRVFGIRSGLVEDWAEIGSDRLTWDTSPCRDGTGDQVLLGNIEYDNRDDAFADRVDAIRLVDDRLTTFIRDHESDLVTIALIRETRADYPAKWKSKEGDTPAAAPGIALRAD